MLLGINTASYKSEICLISDEIKEKSWESNGDEAQKLLPEIENLLGDKGFQDIKKIFVISGPGSFVSLRIGLTVADSLRNMLNIPLYQENLFEHLKHRTKKGVPILVKASRKEVYNESQEKHPITNFENQEVTGDLFPDHLEFVRYVELEKTFAETLKEYDFSKMKTFEKVEPLYLKAPY